MKSIRNIIKNPNFYLYLIIFLVMFILTSNMHYNADEYNYSNIPWTNIRIQSFSDILNSQKLLYTHWTGRVLVHFLIQTFLFIGYNVYSIVNSLVFCLFIYLILNLIQAKKTPYILLLAFFTIWLFAPVFGETTIWLSGSINYLWPSTLFLLLLNLYSRDNFNTALLMIVALFSGASHEMIVICGGAYFLLDICIGKFNKKKSLVFSCFLIGGLFLVLAPGNFLRAAESLPILRKVNIIKIIIGVILFSGIVLINTKSKTTFAKYKEQIKCSKIPTVLSGLCILLFILLVMLNLTNYYPSNLNGLIKIYNFRFLLTLVSIAVFLALKCIKHNIPTEKLLPNLNLFFIGMVSALAMNVMPECPDRSFFLSCTFISTSVIGFATYLEFRKSYFLTSTIFALSIITLTLTLRFYVTSLASWKKDFNSEIKAYEGQTQAVLPIQPAPSSLVRNYYGAAPSQLTSNPNSIANIYAAHYYNFQEIIGIQKNFFIVKITKDNLDKSKISFEYTEDGITKRSYPDETLIAVVDTDKNEAFIPIPLEATNVKLINNSEIEITRDDITTIKAK
ncbi:DUF6056 family protein [Clostridium cibarium]|uniref:Uncharacterized protein n=1 Tax=Clostridium cibarium TaxID=2762247 RepID=A0ABR8PQB6_9CLOT|nr:DUF6056 family protein [Clostridium cibarium]MBD7910315.1 hypothetical protein [Clostridium cibarium]